MYSILPESNVEPENIWMFPKIGVPQNGWFIMKNPIKMDDLGVPLFLETPIWPFFFQGPMLVSGECMHVA